MSKETDSIIAFVKASGVLFKVTDIATPGVHAAHSYHYAKATPSESGSTGLAVDFAGPTPNDLPAMKKIFDVLAPQAPLLAELIHAGPGITKAVKNGKWANGIALYGPTTWQRHVNHIHCAVPRGTVLTPATAVPVHTETVPIPVHDYEEAATKTTMMHIGRLDDHGRGWADWQPGLGRDPIVVAVTLLGPSPPDDGYWEGQEKIQLSAQPRGGAVRVVVRGGTPGDTVTAFLTVA